MLEGETPACRSRRHTRLRARQLRHRGFSNKRKAWKSNDMVELKRLLDDFPCLYLEEICYGLEIRTGKSWSVSHIGNKIRNLGISLQVVYGRARQIDAEQRSRYKYTIANSVYFTDQLVFIDETHKGELSNRRRKH